MRIISGKYKSRRLYTSGVTGYKNKPVRKEDTRKGEYIRPTSDRAKETLFDVLSNLIDFNGITCLDLFAGTGSLGFESLSRGAEFCSFVDNSRISAELIEKNAEALDCSENVEIYKQSVLSFLPEHTGEKYDLIFADPPYAYTRYSELIELVLRISFSIFVIEHDIRYEFELSKKDLNVLEKRAGKTMFTILSAAG